MREIRKAEKRIENFPDENSRTELQPLTRLVRSIKSAFESLNRRPSTRFRRPDSSARVWPAGECPNR